MEVAALRVAMPRRRTAGAAISRPAGGVVAGTARTTRAVVCRTARTTRAVVCRTARTAGAVVSGPRIAGMPTGRGSAGPATETTRSATRMSTGRSPRWGTMITAGSSARTAAPGAAAAAGISRCAVAAARITGMSRVCVGGTGADSERRGAQRAGDGQFSDELLEFHGSLPIY